MEQNKASLSAKDFFIHVGTIVTLYVSAGSLIALIFQIINNQFKDALDYYPDPYSNGIRIAIASLIVVFPLFLVLSRLLENGYREVEGKRELGIRKWLIYITLFIAGAVVAGDLIAVINSFLGGELTVRFVLKALTVLVIAGGIVGFYLSDIKNKVTARGRGIVAGGSLIVIVLSLVFGFVVLGSPFTVRLDRFDDQKVSHLQEIQWQVVYFWQAKQKLPATLGELTDIISGFKAPVDPQDGSNYEYVVKGPTSFTLCAQFNRESTTDRGTPYATTKPITIDEEVTDWNHKAGRVCFDKTIDPEKYPPLTPAKPR